MDKDFPNGSGSWCPPEQIIEQKSNIDYNVGQRTELERIFSSAKNCTQPEQNNDSGAGANAGSREEMVFVTTDPLSELVWSPHKGLSLKCADCSLSDKKAFLWGMVLSPQQNNTSGEKNDIEPSAGGNVNPSPMLHQLDCKISDRVTLIGSSSSTKSVMPTCQTTNHEYKLGPGEVMKDLTKKDEEPVINSNHEYDHSDKKGKRVRVPIGLQSTETSRIRKKTDSSNPKKASIEGFDNGGTTDSSSTRLNEEKLSSERTNQECGDSEKGTSADPFEESRAIDTGNSHTAGVDSKSAYKPSASKQYKCSDTPLPLSTLACENREGLASIIQDDGMKIIPAAYSNALLEKEDSTSENDFEPLKGENASVEVGIASHPDNDLEHSGNQNGALPEDKIALIEASPINRRVPLILRKDKEKILSYSVANVETPNNDDDSHESIESCNNSKGLILSRKRPWSCDQQLAIENKKMKKQTFEDAHCTSVQKHGSSFMYWISNMVKGSSKSDLKETTSLDLVMKPAYDEHGDDDQHFMLQEKNQQSGCASTGFGTIFKSLYCSGRNVSSTGMSNIDHQLGKGLKEFELELDNKTYHSSSIPVTCSEENVKLCKETIVSTEYQAICEDGGGPSALPDIPSTNISVVREDPVKNRNLLRIPCDHGNNQQISSSSSFQIGLDFQSEKKESLKLCSSTANESSNFVISRSPPLGSLWITRFCPKVSPPVIDSSQCKQNNGASVEDPTGRIKILSSQNCVVAGKDQISCEDCQDPSTEDIFDAANRGVQNCIVNTAGSFGSIRVKEHTDQRFKSSINTIQPSQRSINSEAMTSVFARRLDALRHIVPSEVEGNIRHSSTPCIFCGIRGHKLQECSEITESELDALLRKVNSYDGAEESSCLCIRCFQLNHWAIACPKISSKNRSRSNGSSSLLDIRGFGKIVHTTRKDKVAYNAKRTLSDNMVRGDAVALSVSDGKKPRVDTEVRDGNKKVSDEMIFNRSYSDSKLTKKDVLKNNIFEGDISREFIHRGKQTRTSSSTENVSKDYQITAIYNFVNRQIPAIPRGTFEAIKKLRLSRTEIFKWRRSPVSSFPLEGFFIRLRLRKSEKELGSTGYYVARLNGGLREKFSGSSKVPLSVKIGGFKCLVESRFVSNHDFLEDELLAWWCATLKGGGNLPSEKDLEMKLEQRKSFGF